MPKRFVVGHDYRSYSASVKQALINGLLAGGAEVHDIGLALSPMAYFAQFALEVEGVAMVTASHNDNGWTGIKMGMNRPLTFGPDEMTALKEIVLGGAGEPAAGGRYVFVPDIAERYIAALTNRPKLKRRLKVVCACGNGTAGAFAPQVLEAIGCEVVPLDCDLDYTFPRYNPNPEDMKMLHAMSEAVLAHKADVGFGFDGDGDRCGVVDNEGHEIFADKVGVMLARDLSAQHRQRRVRRRREVDRPVHDRSGAAAERRPRALLEDRPLLHEALHARAEGAGRLREVRPLLLPAAARPRLRRRPGRGASPCATCSIAIPDKTLADLKNALPKTWGSPTMSPHCADETKYGIVDKITAQYKDACRQRRRRSPGRRFAS